MTAGHAYWSVDGARRRREVDVWTITLDASLVGRAAGADTLSQDEHDRCARFRHAVHRERFRTGRIALRSILSRYAGVPPAKLDFANGPAGKPYLVGDIPHKPHFSFSRAKGLAMLAISPEPVGLDVETVDPTIVSAGVASAAFHSSEVRAWSSLPAANRTRGFFKGWTSREAVVKAEGTGLTSPSRFSICVDPELPPRILHGAAGWRLHAVDCAGPRAAVICTPYSIETLRLLRWDD